VVTAGAAVDGGAGDGGASHAPRLAAPEEAAVDTVGGAAVRERLLAATAMSKTCSGGNWPIAMFRFASRSLCRKARAVCGENGAGDASASSRASSGAEKLVPESRVNQSPGIGATIPSPGA